jgi:Flp pilus assembly protein TadG
MPATPQSSLVRAAYETVRRRFARFTRKQDGSAAVEFALVAFPFFGLTFAILETALVFFANQTLQAAAGDAARLIMTGQAQTASYTASDFKTQVCNRIYALFNCTSSMSVDVKTYTTFGSVSNTPPVSNGQFNSNSMSYTLGGPGCIQVVTLYYQWPIYASFLKLVNSNGNIGTANYLLQATSVFKNEPYSNSGGC